MVTNWRRISQPTDVIGRGRADGAQNLSKAVPVKTSPFRGIPNLGGVGAQPRPNFIHAESRSGGLADHFCTAQREESSKAVGSNLCGGRKQASPQRQQLFLFALTAMRSARCIRVTLRGVAALLC